MPDLTTKIKDLALQMGAANVGVASRENLAGPPTADPDHVLPGARSVVAFLTIEPEHAILAYLGKQDAEEYREHFFNNIQTLGKIGIAIRDLLRKQGHDAEAISPNGVYEPGSSAVSGLIPAFSHRYAAFAAGLGALGLNGNLMTPEWGSRVYLSSVITSAPLQCDEPLDWTPCDGCNICLKACPSRFLSWEERVTFTLAGRTVTHAKRGIHARCAISCVGYTGLSPDGKWSTWAPSHHAIPENDTDLLRLYVRLAAEHRERVASDPDTPDFGRASLAVADYARPGVLARNRHDTATTCGNCAIVCFETLGQRARALKALTRSGVVMREQDGSLTVVSAEEARDYRMTHMDVPG